MLSNKVKLAYLLLFISFQVIAQEKYNKHSISASYSLGRVFPYKDYFKGNKGISRNIIVSYNQHTFGKKEWEREFNFPTYGVAFVYQKNQAHFLGNVYSLMLHYTHYLYKRKIAIRIADGLSFATNPYDKENNKKNIFVTSTVSNGFMLSVEYKEENIWKRLGFQLGASFTHYSNGATRLKNKGLNAWFIQAGINYSLGEKENEFIYEGESTPLDKRIYYNLVCRDGFNENSSETAYDYLFTISAFAEKRLDKKRAVQAGVDFFASDFLKHLLASSSNKKNSNRVGLFIGHDLILNKLHIPIQLGYYVYNPSDYKSNFYQRIGAKYMLHKNIFVAIALKTHLGQAEAIEYGLGIKV